MEDQQFDQLMKKLEEIRCGIIDVETNTEIIQLHGPGGAISEIRSVFYQKLEAKTGWGRNEIKAAFNEAVESVL